jgi:hypothetical protein
MEERQQRSEDRLGELEQRVAVAQQRTEDHESDIRAFAPALIELAEARADLRALRLVVTSLEARVESGKKENASNRALIRVAAFGLAGTFLTSTGAVIAAILGGGP